MSIVLDSSATLAWIYPYETSSSARSVLETVKLERAWVPALWRLEIANVLEMGVRQGRHDSRFRDATLADLALLPIATDPDTNHHAWQVTVLLAERHHLTVYDAAYLELALRRALPLATLDRELRTAAEAEADCTLSLPQDLIREAESMVGPRGRSGMRGNMRSQGGRLRPHSPEGQLLLRCD